MIAPSRLQFGRIVRRIIPFAYRVALEFLIPDPVDKVYKVCQHFYENFIVIDLNERVELFRELGDVSANDEAELVDCIVDELAQQMPSSCPLPRDEVRHIIEREIKGLRVAHEAEKAGRDPAEALRKSLNANMPGGRVLDASKLDATQRSIGQLLLASRMEALAKPPINFNIADAPALPGYTYLKGLGSGGFGTVVLARHEPTGTLRALKFGPLTDPARFRQEVELARRLNSPHLVKYFESGEANGHFWIAMEYLGDTTLADLMRQPTFRARMYELPQIGEQLLAGLADLHAAGMIHRDLKPENVMVDDQFRLKLIDFGLAKPVDKLHGYASTATGTLIGSPWYMSPEQMKGKKDLNPASDIYSAGALIYELFAGYPPHRAESFADVVLKAYTETVPFNLPALPSALRPFLKKCLSRDAVERFADGSQALDDYRGPARDASRRLRHDYFKESWVPVLERGLLEKFAADNLGLLLEDATEQFLRRVHEYRLPECDAERLAEILPPIFAAQHKVQVAEETVTQVRSQLRADVLTLTPVQLRQRADEVHKLEAAVIAAKELLTKEVRQLLADEVAAWDSLVEAKRKAEAADEAKRQQDIRAEAEIERKRIEAEAQQKLVEQRERDRLKSEEQLRKQRKQEEQAQWRAKQWASMRTTGKYLGWVVMILSAVSVIGYGCLSVYDWIVPDYTVEFVLTGHKQSVESVAFSPDGTHLASGGRDNTVQVWDATIGNRIHTLTGHTGWVNSVAFDPRGTRIASASSDGTVRVWDTSTGKELHKLTGDTKRVDSVAFSPDGSRLALGCVNIVRVWDIASGKELHELTGHKGAMMQFVNAVAFSPDGSRLASASSDNTVRVWDVATGQMIHTLSGHTGSVTSVAFNPDGTRIASGSNDFSVRVWNVSTGKELHSLKAGISSFLSFSADGTRINAGCVGDLVLVWDAKSGKELANIEGPMSTITTDNAAMYFAISPDGKHIASGCKDGIIRIWKPRK